MTAIAHARSLTTAAEEGSIRKIFPIKAGEVIHPGTLVMLDSSGRALAGATATRCYGIGSSLIGPTSGTLDNSTGSDGTLHVEVYGDEVVTGPWGNSTLTDALALSDIGSPCYIVDNQTLAKTSGSGTRSPGGRVVWVDSRGVWISTEIDDMRLIGGAPMTQTYSTTSATVAAMTMTAALTENGGAVGGTNDGDLPSLTPTYSARTADVGGTVDGAWEDEGVVSTGGGNTYSDAAVNGVLGKVKNNIAEAKTVILQLAADNVALRAALREAATAINQLRADLLVAKQNLNAVIDACQAAGVIGA